MDIDKDKILISHSPHLWKGFSTTKLMYMVVIALLLPLGAGIYFFGLSAVYIVLASVITCFLTELVIKKLRKKQFVNDGSAVITGILFALVLPPRMPIWMVVVGAFFAIAVVKEAFGGLGHNIFNPALGARAFLAVSFPQQMTAWVAPSGFNADAVTTATPLGQSFAHEGSKASLYWDMFIGNTGGSIGETSALLIILGGIFLLAFRIIEWRIPVFYIGTVALLSYVLGSDPLFSILAGGLMIGAFFMATDYVTSPTTSNGKIIFGVGLGLLTVLIRRFGSLPEGVAFSILIMNAFTPLIDKYLKRKPFGFQKKETA
ncbi:MAG: RnfABCDGE type electron transport complex subunit D [Actinomycetota bacterium]|nr:RnfABCDGE type electron transport complex subunit D [Actinomycetota bacterium]